MNIHVVLGKREREINKLNLLLNNGTVFSKASSFFLNLVFLSLMYRSCYLRDSIKDFIESLRADPFHSSGIRVMLTWFHLNIALDVWLKLTLSPRNKLDPLKLCQESIRHKRNLLFLV